MQLEKFFDFLKDEKKMVYLLENQLPEILDKYFKNKK